MYNDLELEKDCVISIAKLASRVLYVVEIDDWALFFWDSKDVLCQSGHELFQSQRSFRRIRN